MAARTISIDLPDELFEGLADVAEKLGLGSAEQAAVVAIGDWVGRRQSELADRDPAQRYFVNEALDELNKKKS